MWHVIWHGLGLQTNTSQMSVLVNEEKFCFQSSGGRGGSICNDDGYGHFNTTGPINEATDWAPVNIKTGILLSDSLSKCSELI
jgi:hypothetical protein